VRRWGRIVVESQGPKSIAIEFNGRTINGSYKIRWSVLTVTSDFGRKSAHVAPFATNPEGLARIMLCELAEADSAKVTRLE
jgi:hypothetical protein